MSAYCNRLTHIVDRSVIAWEVSNTLTPVSVLALTSLPAVKAVTAAQLSMASDGIYRVTLDEAIEAMRLTAADMSVKYKETSLSVSLQFGLFDRGSY